MAATRRLQLAAEGGRTIALLLKRHGRMGDDPLGVPSAAVTRWRIGCTPSTPLPCAGIGRARWRVELMRQKGGIPGNWTLEGCDETGRCALPARLVDRPAAEMEPDLALWPETGFACDRDGVSGKPPHADIATVGRIAAAERAVTCSVPRGGGWRPGARWAKVDIQAAIEALPAHQRPPMRELGRRSEAVDHPFRRIPGDDGGTPARFHDVRARMMQRTTAPDADAEQVLRPRPPGEPDMSQAAPLVTTHRIGARVEVAAACLQARALGISPGMALTQARAQTPGLVVYPAIRRAMPPH